MASLSTVCAHTGERLDREEGAADRKQHGVPVDRKRVCLRKSRTKLIDCKKEHVNAKRGLDQYSVDVVSEDGNYIHKKVPIKEVDANSEKRDHVHKRDKDEINATRCIPNN